MRETVCKSRSHRQLKSKIGLVSISCSPGEGTEIYICNIRRYNIRTCNISNQSSLKHKKISLPAPTVLLQRGIRRRTVPMQLVNDMWISGDEALINLVNFLFEFDFSEG